MAYTNRNFTWDFDALKRFYEKYIVKWLNSAVSWTDAQKKQARANLGFGDGDIDDEPTAGSDNLVKSGGVSKAIDLFSLPMANKVIKELYMPNVDYQNVKNITICIAAAVYSGTYYNRIRLVFEKDGSDVTYDFYNKSFETQEEAIEDIQNIPTFIDNTRGMIVLNADSFIAGTYHPEVPVSINKDISLLGNAPIISSHVLRLFEGGDVRKFAIWSSGKLGMSDAQSYIITVNVIPGKKYKIVNERYSTSRFVSFTSDSTGQIEIPHEVNGNAVVRSSYGRGVTIRTAPVGAKYMHLQTQYDGDTDSFPYVTVFEIDADVEEFKEQTATEIATLKNTIYDIQEYTDSDLNAGYYSNKNASIGATFDTDSIKSGTGWKCLKIRVKRNDNLVFIATTYDSTLLRPYTLTNDRGIVVQSSDIGETLLIPPVNITAAEDGYLYINVKTNKVKSEGLTFSLTVSNSKIDAIIPDDVNPLSVVKETAGLTSVIHKLGVIGASFTNGGHNKTSGSFPVSIAREFSWPQRLAKLCGNTAYNFGRSGMTCKQWLDDVDGYYTQVGQIDYVCDAYYITFASNDVGQDYPLGSIADVYIGNESENAASFYGYLSKIVARCHNVQQRAYLFMQTYPYNYSNTDTNGYNQAIRDIAAAYRSAGYRIYLIDYATYGMTISQAQNKGMFRGSHFVGTGYQYMTYEICTYIDWIIKHNMDDFKDIAFVQTDAEYIE